MCNRKAKDPIADALYEQDRLMILSRGRAPTDLFPGCLIRKPSPATGRDLVFEAGDRIFSNWSRPDVTERPYRRISRDSQSNELDVSAAAHLAQVLFPRASKGGGLEAALKKAGAHKLRVALLGAWHCSMDMAQFEFRAPEFTATELAMRYSSEKQRFFLVTDTLQVTSASITLGDRSISSAFVKGEADDLAAAGITARLESDNSASVVLDPGEDDVVIALSAVELEMSDGRIGKIAAPKRPLGIRLSRQDRASQYGMAELDDLQQGNEMLLALSAEEA